MLVASMMLFSAFASQVTDPPPAQVAATVREWRETDPQVAYMPGSRTTAYVPQARWSGEIEFHVRCVIAPDGRLTACATLEDVERYVGRDAGTKIFRRIRVQFTPDGPRPGDGITYRVVMSQD